MSGYEVDYRQLLDQARAIANEADQYERTAASMKQAAETLAKCWEGVASQRFAQEQERMYEWFIQMGKVSREYSETATRAAVKYLDAEQAARDAINKR